jgi:hypothetical protein
VNTLPGSVGDVIRVPHFGHPDAAERHNLRRSSDSPESVPTGMHGGWQQPDSEGRG